MSRDMSEASGQLLKRAKTSAIAIGGNCIFSFLSFLYAFVRKFGNLQIGRNCTDNLEKFCIEDRWTVRFNNLFMRKQKCFVWVYICNICIN
jgi:hypothetical protein